MLLLLSFSLSLSGNGAYDLQQNSSSVIQIHILLNRTIYMHGVDNVDNFVIILK